MNNVFEQNIEKKDRFFTERTILVQFSEKTNERDGK